MMWRSVVLLGLGFYGVAHAQLLLIQRDGPTVVSAPYIRVIQYPKQGEALQHLQQERGRFLGKKIAFHALLLPVRSTLRAGEMASHAVRTNRLAHPLFVIGDDPFSLRWVKMHAEDLKERGAFGIITQVDTLSRVRAIEKAIPISLWPMTLLKTDLPAYLHITHYPFLWTKGGIVQ